MRKDRIRIVGAEGCRRCHAGVTSPCRNKFGAAKPTCMVENSCRRCCAQRGDCRCPMPIVGEDELFPPMSSVWMPIDFAALVGRTADDQRRSVP